MPLLSLPNEILLIIASSLNQTDTNSLLLTNLYFASLLTPRLKALSLLDRDSWTALQWAVSNRSESHVLALLQHGTNIDFLPADSDTMRVHQTALQLAAGSADKTMVRLLLVHGADVSARSPHEATALHMAVRSGCAECVTLLLQYGADVSAVDEDERTPLLWAVGFRFAGIVKVLLESGADAGAVCKGFKPLHWAVQLVDGAVIRMLLQHGADPMARDEVNGWTPLERLVRFGVSSDEGKDAARALSGKE